MELDTLEIGKRIRERRKELHLTQLDIKEKTGISSGNMSDIERGNRLPAQILYYSFQRFCNVPLTIF